MTPTRRILWLALELRRAHTQPLNVRRAQSIVAELCLEAGQLDETHVKELDAMFAPKTEERSGG